MDKRVLDNLIAVTTKSSDKNVIYKALVKLRTDVVKDKDGIQRFYDAGGIAPMVRLISKPYEKILEVALSILGNCCTQKKCCKQAISNGIVPPLLTILKSIPNPRVQCRVCRLLGNLARESNEKLCTLAKGIGVVMASVLEDTKDVPTLCMTVRAIRLLWNEMPFYEEFVRFDGVDKILGILIKSTMVQRKQEPAKSIVEQNPHEKERVEFMETHIQFMESVNSNVFDHEILKKTKPPNEDAFEIPASQDQRDLFAEILKCLETVTNLPAFRIVYNFYQHQHSCSCIIFFASADSPFRSQSLKILANLSKSSGKSVLTDADAMTMACNLITATNLTKPLSESEERHCVCVISFLADDACNRAKVRKSGALKRLLELAKNTTSDSFLTMILIGLQHFRYDNMSTDLMIRMGLVNVLIERLEINTKDLTESHTTDVLKDIDIKKSREDDDDDMDAINPKRSKVDFSPPTFIPREIDSPPASLSSGSIYLSSPGNSPCSSNSPSPRSLSPANKTGGIYDDIDDYSPVVSDIEDQNDEDADTKVTPTKSKRTAKDEIDKDNIDILQQILSEQSAARCELEEENLSDGDEAEAEEGKDKKEKEPSSIDISEKKKTAQLVLSILCSASYRLKHTPFDLSLCTPQILNTLVKTCRVAYKRRTDDTPWDAQGAPLVLSHIVSEIKNFVPLLKRDFIFKIYEMAQPMNEHKDCTLCTDLKHVGAGLLNLLNELAETGYGRGEIAHLLLKDDKEMHKQVSIISAMVIRDPKILNTLLIKHGGLYTIIDLILTKDEKLSNQAATGLTALAKQLNVKIPKYNSKRISKSEVVVYGDASEQAENPREIEEDFVLFVAGNDANESSTMDVEVIKFSEKILTENSDVFNRMFNSDFQESKNKRVVLKNQSIAGIKYFLDCIERYSKGEPLQKPIALLTTATPENDPSTSALGSNKGHSIAIKAALEAYDMCQIYLLPELEKDIFNMIVCLLDADNILDVFIFSLKQHKQELTEISINYYLTSNISGEDKVRVFRDADNSDYFKEWNELILDTIVYTCQNLIL